MKVKEISAVLENYAPLSLQETYDNSGLIIGEPDQDIDGALICIDVTEEILDEAIANDLKLIIAHHPLIFKGLKKINAKTEVGRIVKKALKNDISIYAYHTNIDNVANGVNGIVADKLQLQNIQVLKTMPGLIKKIATYCPVNKADDVREALFNAGAGQIGEYESCSFNIEGIGSFKGGKDSNPVIGEKLKFHLEKEVRIETIYPKYNEKKIIEALYKSHPYEEIAYDLYSLDNEFLNTGAGIIGELNKAVNEIEFLQRLKDEFKIPCIKHTKLLQKKIKKVAFCGGSGSFLISNAINAGSDIFISGDIKYHDFFEADKKMLIADIGHYESEQFTKELIYSILIKKFPTFALRISEYKTNPVHYF